MTATIVVTLLNKHSSRRVALHLAGSQQSIAAQMPGASGNHLATSQCHRDNHARTARSNHLAASQNRNDDRAAFACGNNFDNQTKGQQ